jgi:tetratricopeptide (TPR) repeat protein
MSKSKFLSVSLLASLCAAGAAPRLGAQQPDPPAATAAGGAANEPKPNAAGGEKPADNAGEPPAENAAAASPRSPELAVRYAALAQETLRQKNVVAPHFRQAAALITAAMRLDPNEPRYPKMLYEAMLQLRDADGALRALKAYRGTTQQAADDQLAMVSYIDLSARAVETAEGRMDYYRKFLDSRAPDPVKAHAAFRASQVARERGQSDVEDEMLAECLKLNPLNMDALRVRLEQQAEKGTAGDRVATLLAMIRSNPAQLPVIYNLAREVANAGLVEDALRYYTLGVDVATRQGTPIPQDYALGYASELYLGGQPQMLAATRSIVDQLLKQDPNGVESLLLRWYAERAGGENDAAAKTQRQVVNAALNRVATLRQQLGVTGAGAATRPVESPDAPTIPDLSGDVAKIKDEKNAALVEPYTDAVADLAWYLVAVANQPAETAKLLPTLKALLSDKDPIVVRIEGWTFLAQEQYDQAGVKLRAVADKDVLARAGTYLLWAQNPAERPQAVAAATKLLQEQPSGLLAVVLSDTLRDLKVKLTPRDKVDDVRKALADFPKDWLRIIEAPQSFYQLKAEMAGGRVLFPFGEPMMAVVTIRNVSNFDITIGPEGVIRNDLWFDAQLRGLVQQLVTGAAYERIGQALVLKPGASISQSVRIDQGQLAQVLAGYPNPTLSFFGQVRTNPMGNASGPCGYAVGFGSITERSGFPLNDGSLKALSNLATNGSVPEKLRSLDLIAAELESLRQQKESDQVKALITSFAEALSRGASDPDPVVATWGSFLTAAHDASKLARMRDRLLGDPEPTRRVIGLMASNGLPLEGQKAIVEKVLAEDKDEMVRMYATGMREIAQMVADQPAATQPAPSAPGSTNAPPAGANPIPGGGNK